MCIEVPILSSVTYGSLHVAPVRFLTVFIVSLSDCLHSPPNPIQLEWNKFNMTVSNSGCDHLMWAWIITNAVTVWIKQISGLEM